MKLWLAETRPQFLLLSAVLVFFGTSVAWYNGVFLLAYALLAFLGLLLCHIAVNVLNDYFDYRSGIDQEATRTPFSGGSGILPASLLTPRQVLCFGLVSFLLAMPIGVYFVLTRGWLLLPLLVVGASCTLLYTPRLTRLRWPEWAPGLGLGALPVLGAYFVQTTSYTVSAVVASVPSFILVHNLLLLNEFPDTEADKKAGRKTLPIVMGKAKAGILFSALTLVAYLWIVIWMALGIMPIFCVIALLTLPLAIRAFLGALKSDVREGLISAMANNVLVVLLTQLFLGFGYILGRVL